MRKKIQIVIEPIFLHEETPREIFTRLFKKNKMMIVPQLIKGTNYNKNTVNSQLFRMVEDGLLTREHKVVQTNPKFQARHMTVYIWQGEKKKNGRK